MDTAPTEIYTLSLHDALPISFFGAFQIGEHEFGDDGFDVAHRIDGPGDMMDVRVFEAADDLHQDRKSTRLNSSHTVISYAVFCLKKKKKNRINTARRTDQEQS